MGIELINKGNGTTGKHWSTMVKKEKLKGKGLSHESLNMNQYLSTLESK